MFQVKYQELFLHHFQAQLTVDAQMLMNEKIKVLQDVFFFNFLFYFIFIYGCVGSSFLCEGFLQLRQVGTALHRGARASHYRGPSHCRAQAPDAQAQQLWLTGLVAPWHVGSSQTRTRTRVSCIGRQTLNHCATREALQDVFDYGWISSLVNSKKELMCKTKYSLRLHYSFIFCLWIICSIISTICLRKPCVIVKITKLFLKITSLK